MGSVKKKKKERKWVWYIFYLVLIPLLFFVGEIKTEYTWLALAGLLAHLLPLPISYYTAKCAPIFAHVRIVHLAEYSGLLLHLAKTATTSYDCCSWATITATAFTSLLLLVQLYHVAGVLYPVTQLRNQVNRTEVHGEIRSGW